VDEPANQPISAALDAPPYALRARLLTPLGDGTTRDAAAPRLKEATVLPRYGVLR